MSSAERPEPAADGPAATGTGAAADPVDVRHPVPDRRRRPPARPGQAGRPARGGRRRGAGPRGALGARHRAGRRRHDPARRRAGPVHRHRLARGPRPARRLRRRPGRARRRGAGAGAGPPLHRQQPAQGAAGRRREAQPAGDHAGAGHTFRHHYRGRARPDHRRPAGRAARLRRGAPDLHRARGRGRLPGRGGPADRPHVRLPGGAGEPGAPGPHLLPGRRRPLGPARRLGGPLPLGPPDHRPHHLRRALRLADHGGRRARPRLGPPGPDLQRPGPGRRACPCCWSAPPRRWR